MGIDSSGKKGRLRMPTNQGGPKWKITCQVVYLIGDSKTRRKADIAPRPAEVGKKKPFALCPFDPDPPPEPAISQFLPPSSSLLQLIPFLLIVEYPSRPSCVEFSRVTSALLPSLVPPTNAPPCFAVPRTRHIWPG